MSCTFWNMRRRLKAQQANDKIIATAQANEKAEEKAKVEKAIKPKKAGAKKNDKGTN